MSTFSENPTVTPLLKDFKSYVAAGGASPSRSFHRYLDLPPEIRMMILRFCDGPTLFQLMRTSSCVRTDSAKRFWSLTDVWFQVHDFLMKRNVIGEHFLDCCPLAARQIQQVQIKNKVTWRLCTDRTRDRIPEAARAFWHCLRRCFPMVRQVLLEYDYQLPTAPSRARVRLLLRSCPSIIKLVLVCRADPDEELICLLQSRSTGCHIVRKHQWSGERVTMPHITGPLGLVLEWRRLKILKNDADIYASGSRKRVVEREGDDWSAPLSWAKTQAVDYQEALEICTAKLRSIIRRIESVRGEAGSWKREEIEVEFIAQLEEDPLYDFFRDPLQGVRMGLLSKMTGDLEEEEPYL